MKNFDSLGMERGSRNTNVYIRNCLKRRRWVRQLTHLRVRAWWKKEVFEIGGGGGGGWDPNPQYGLLRHQTKKLIINHTFPSLEHLFVIHKIYKRHFHLKNEKTLKVLEILVDSRYCLEINPSFFHVFLDFLKICFSSNLL